jgi:SAM-dependent methyltransferase
MIYHKSKQIFLFLIPKNILNKFEKQIRSLFAFCYKGSGVTCPICERDFKRFIPLNPDKEHTNHICPRCGSAQRQRLLWLYLTAECRILSDSIYFLHFSPRPCLVNKLKTVPGLTYITSDPHEKSMDRQFDLTNVKDESEIFDLIVCYHILEHIPDDRKAMQEVYRLLKPAGIALFQVPYWEDDTYEDPDIQTPDDRRKAFGQQDHVRVYGFQDFINRLSQTGFQVIPVKYGEKLGTQTCNKYVLDEKEVIFSCRKM